MNRIEVGIKIREARKKKGFTQQMLAEAVDISEMYIITGKDFVYSEVTELLDALTPKQRRGAIDILDAYVQSLK